MFALICGGMDCKGTIHALAYSFCFLPPFCIPQRQGKWTWKKCVLLWIVPLWIMAAAIHWGLWITIIALKNDSSPKWCPLDCSGVPQAAKGYVECLCFGFHHWTEHGNIILNGALIVCISLPMQAQTMPYILFLNLCCYEAAAVLTHCLLCFSIRAIYSKVQYKFSVDWDINSISRWDLLRYHSCFRASRKSTLVVLRKMLV